MLPLNPACVLLGRSKQLSWYAQWEDIHAVGCVLRDAVQPGEG